MANHILLNLKRAKYVLDKNWIGNFTQPSRFLYPHQWNWDSAFISIGYSHFNTKRAITELTSLFNAQWKNGMVPQIVFTKKNLGSYFPEPEIWQTSRSKFAPDNYLTSGISMPPIHAYAVLKIYENSLNKNKVLPFIKWIFPKLIKSHQYFYKYRCHDDFIYVIHPWESGMDNSPAWDNILENIDINKVTVPAFKRKDLSTDNAEMRPKDSDYTRYIYLVELFKKYSYQESKIFENSPFIVADTLFNSVISASNKALLKLAKILKNDSTEILEWDNRTTNAVRNKLYSEKDKIFYSYDLKNNSLLKADTAAGFMPLFGGIATEKQAETIYSYLNSTGFCSLLQGNCFTIPNYDTKKTDYDRKNYWRGPVWININWMLWEGLKRYAYIQKADDLARDIIQLPVRFGFFEYFDSFNGRGYGTKDFSWSAALFTDLCYEYYIKHKKNKLSKTRKILLNSIVLNNESSYAITDQKNISQLLLTKVKELKKEFYTDSGTINYQSLQKSKQYNEYKMITNSLRKFDLNMLNSENEKKAFWINVYNTVIVDSIVQSGIKTSVKEVIGLFSKCKYNIGNKLFSADDIEHGILRCNARHAFRKIKQFHFLNSKKKYIMKNLDVRIHFALVCGSRSCAPIKYYSSNNIDNDLEIATRNFINSSEVMVLPENNRLLVSSIFKWYKNDFGGKNGIINIILKYLNNEEKKEFLSNNRKKIKIEYLYYDWNLNK